jgi:hypothetical protein
MDPVLAGVYRRGHSLRRQRAVRRVAAGALSLQLLVALPFAFRQGDEAGGRNVRVVAPAGLDDEVSATTTEVPVLVEAGEEPAPTTAVPPAATPSTTALVCRNSTDPRCGPFRWDPDPGPNAPVTVQITFSPEHPRVGEEVTFTITISDPDAAEIRNSTGLCLDEPYSACASSMRFTPCDRYGPWDPPPRKPGSWTWTSDHTFQQSGTFRASYLVVTGSNGCSGALDPYSSQDSGFATVVVAPAETTTTTTTS